MNLTASDLKRRALGKGLDSLLPRVPAASAPAAENEGGKPLEIPIGQIDRNPFQTRSQLNEEQLGELAASITSNGVVQPVLVRPLANGRFQLIAGERRWKASEMAGKKTVPAILRRVSDEQAMEITIVENLQRTDLNPMEQARAFERLSRDFHMTQEQMATRTGKDRATVANFLRLLKLPSSVQARVESGELSFGHARALLAFEHAEDMEKAAQRVVKLSLSVRQTEAYIQGITHPEKGAKKDGKEERAIDPNIRAVQEQLQRALGLKVHIEDHNGHGKVIIEYARLEDFDGLLEQLAGE
ncbi:MAG: ParB/RepB/Spo0J family partition protein [Terracidiphilus sp.]|jgi:ParB family chromosome partitioning protein